MAVLVGFIAFPDNSRLITAFCQMPVKTVGCRVQRPIGEPFDMQIGGVIGHITDLGIGLNPIDPFAMFRPKPIWVSDRFGVERLIPLGINMCVFGKRCAWLKNRLLIHLSPLDPLFRSLFTSVTFACCSSIVAVADRQARLICLTQ